MLSVNHSVPAAPDRSGRATRDLRTTPPIDPGHWTTGDFWDHYTGGGGDPVDLHDIGLFDMWYDEVSDEIESAENAAMFNALVSIDASSCGGGPGHFHDRGRKSTHDAGGGDLGNPLYSIGKSQPAYEISCSYVVECECCNGVERIVFIDMCCTISWSLDDWLRTRSGLALNCRGLTGIRSMQSGAASTARKARFPATSIAINKCNDLLRLF